MCKYVHSLTNFNKQNHLKCKSASVWKMCWNWITKTPSPHVQVQPFLSPTSFTCPHVAVPLLINTSDICVWNIRLKVSPIMSFSYLIHISKCCCAIANLYLLYMWVNYLVLKCLDIWKQWLWCTTCRRRLRNETSSTNSQLQHQQWWYPFECKMEKIHFNEDILIKSFKKISLSNHVNMFSLLSVPNTCLSSMWGSVKLAPNKLFSYVHSEEVIYHLWLHLFRLFRLDQIMPSHQFIVMSFINICYLCITSIVIICMI